MNTSTTLSVYVAGVALNRPRRAGIGLRIVVSDSAGEELIEDREVAGSRVKNSEELALAACNFGLRQTMKHGAFESAKSVVFYTESLYVTDNVTAVMFSSRQQLPRVYSVASKSTISAWKDLIKELRKTKRRVDFKWISDALVNHHLAAAKAAALRIAGASNA